MMITKLILTLAMTHAVQISLPGVANESIVLTKGAGQKPSRIAFFAGDGLFSQRALPENEFAYLFNKLAMVVQDGEGKKQRAEACLRPIRVAWKTHGGSTSSRLFCADVRGPGPERKLGLWVAGALVLR